MTTTGNSGRSGYFEELADRLRAHGMDEERVTATVTELRDHTAESGTAPAEEFGPADEFAARLAARGADAAEPHPGAERWVFTSDIYADRDLLARFGQQGWEVERIDRLGRFVCRRAAERPMRWEYRREYVRRSRRAALAAELAPDGWEPCGSWTTLSYFKRPVSVSAGPAAELAEAPRTPERRTYFTSRTHALITVGVVSWAVLVVVLVTADADTRLWVSVLVGGLIGAAAGWAGARKDHRKGTTGTVRGVTGPS
ncbi:hypothetical protein ACF1DY_04580 [Streptomyces albus]